MSSSPPDSDMARETTETGRNINWYFTVTIVLLVIPYLSLLISVLLKFDRFGGFVSYIFQQYAATGATATHASWLGLTTSMGCNTVILYMATARLAELGMLIGLALRLNWARIGMMWFIPISLLINYGVVPLTNCHVYKSVLPWGFWGMESVVLSVIAWGFLIHPKTGLEVGKIASNNPSRYDAEKPHG